MLDSTLALRPNVKKRAGSCFYQLRQLRAVRRTLSAVAEKTLVHALITLLVSTIATVYCTASPIPICVHFSQLSTRQHASSPVSASSTTSPTLWSTCTGYQSANASNSSCAHWLASVSAAQRRPTWLTCVSQTSLCRRCPIALICVLPFTVTSSFRGLAWPAMVLAVSPSRVQRRETVYRLIFATCLYPLPVSSTNSRLNCSSGHITCDHSTFVVIEGASEN